MFFQKLILATHHACDHIAHPIIVSQFLMLIPGCILSGLGRPLANLFRCFFLICKKHTSGRTGNNLIAVKRYNVVIAKRAGLLSFIGSTQGFRRIFDQCGMMFHTYRLDFIYFTRCTIKVRYHHHFHLRIKIKGFFQSNRVHIPGIIFCINKNRNTTLIYHRIYCSIKGHVGTEYLISRSYSRQFHSHMECSSSR